MTAERITDQRSAPREVPLEQRVRMLLARLPTDSEEFKVIRRLSGALATEREECAKIAERFGPSRPILTKNPSSIVVGRWEGEQAASAGISAAIRARSK